MTNVLTTFPALKVEIAFGYGPMDAAPAWTDVSAYVIGRVRIHRGRQRLLEQAQTGTCSLTLSNRDGRFSPWNTSSPHYLAGDGMQPGTPIRVTATYAAVTYPIWYGQVDSFGQQWAGEASFTTDLSCSDAFSLFANLNIDTSYYADYVDTANPRGYWRLGEPAGGAYAADSSGNAYNAGVTSSAIFGAEGALVADSDTAADMTAGFAFAPPGAGISGTGPWTVEAWVKFDTDPAATGAYYAWVQPNDYYRSGGIVNSYPYLALGVDPATGVAGITSNNGTGLFSIWGLTSARDIGDGHWHHIAATWDNTTVTLYVDGAVDSSFAYGGGAGHVSIPPNTPAYIGPWSTTGGWALDNAPAAFSVDEVAVYNVALGPVAILARYQLGRLLDHLTSARVAWVLNLVGWPAGMRTIDTGSSMAGKPGPDEALHGTSLLAHLQAVAQAEDGAVFMGADGKVVFQSRNRSFVAPNNLSQCTLGPNTAGGELPYLLPQSSADRSIDNVYTQVQVSRHNGGSATASDAAAAARHGSRTLAISDLPLAGDAELADRANWKLGRAKTPVDRIPQVTLSSTSANHALINPQILGVDLNERVTFKRTVMSGFGTSLSQLCAVAGISHDIDVGRREWRTTWDLDPADARPALILNDATNGLLNGPPLLAY